MGLRGETTGNAGKVRGKTAGGRRQAAPPKLPGEKSVRGTDKTVPVAPEPRSRVPEHPTDPHAVDQRDQFVGTDALRERGSARRTNRPGNRGGK